MQLIQIQLADPLVSGERGLSYFQTVALCVPTGSGIINIPWCTILEHLARPREDQALNIHFPTFWLLPTLHHGLAFPFHAESGV